MRLIDADALIEEIAKIADLRTLSTKTIGEAIDRVPSVEPVTYCKDCFLADLCTWRREGAEYCSYAERKK